MRAKPLLVGGLALLLGACSSGKVSHAPPPLNKELLVGKWKTGSEAQFIAGYEFAADGALKLTLRGMRQPVPGRYAWSGERTLDLEYQPSEELKQAYQAAVRGHRDRVQELVTSGQLPDRAAPSILGGLRDELPAKEMYQVALTDKPRALTLIVPGTGGTRMFEKAD
jgi:hypothetical protein